MSHFIIAKVLLKKGPVFEMYVVFMILFFYLLSFSCAELLCVLNISEELPFFFFLFFYVSRQAEDDGATLLTNF